MMISSVSPHFGLRTLHEPLFSRLYFLEYIGVCKSLRIFLPTPRRLVAGHVTGRNVYAMELAPENCAAILERFEQMGEGIEKRSG